MSHVYVVSVGYDYEGSEVDSIWTSQERAKKRRDILTEQKYGDFINVRVIPVDNLILLQDNSHMVWYHEKIE
jgi:hypothetical protein